MFVVGDRRYYQCRYNSCLNIGVTDVVLVVIVLVAVLIDLQFINVTKIILLFFFLQHYSPIWIHNLYKHTFFVGLQSNTRVFIRTPLFRIRENPQFHRQNEINVTQAASYVPIYLQYTEHGTSLLHLRLFCSFYNVQHVSFFLSSFLLFPFRFSNV